MVPFDSPTGALLLRAAGATGKATSSASHCGNVDWDAFTALAIEHRVAPLVLRNLTTELPETVRARLSASTLRNAQRNLRLTAEMFRVLDVLESAGLKAVPFKGPVTAQLYGDLSLRPFGDLDLFVPVDQVWRARDALRAAAYQPEDDISGGMEADILRWGCEYNMVSPDSTHVVELHWRIAPRAFAVDWEFTERTDVSDAPVSGRVSRVLSNEQHLLVLCVHAAKHLWNTLVWLNDIGLAMQTSLEWRKLESLARAAGAGRICAISFGLAEKLLAHGIHEEAHRLFPTDKAAQTLVDDLAKRIFAPRAEAFTRSDHRLFLRSRERVSDRAAYLWRMLTAPDLYISAPGLQGRLARAKKVVTGSAAGTRA